MDALKTNISLVKNVLRYTIQENALSNLNYILDSLNVCKDAYVLFFIDDYFQSKPLNIKVNREHSFVFVDTKTEPSTNGIDKILAKLKEQSVFPDAIIAVGGGATMDTSKAISNLYTNEGNAEDYQGWDLLKNPSIYKSTRDL